MWTGGERRESVVSIEWLWGMGKRIVFLEKLGYLLTKKTSSSSTFRPRQDVSGRIWYDLENEELPICTTATGPLTYVYLYDDLALLASSASHSHHPVSTRQTARSIRTSMQRLDYVIILWPPFLWCQRSLLLLLQKADFNFNSRET